MGPDDDAQVLADLNAALRELHNALPEYERALAAHDGKIEEFAGYNIHIKDLLEKSADSYKFKLAAVPIRVMADRIKLTGITVDDKAQQTWDDIAKANSLNVWSKETMRRTFIYGDGYMRVWPDEAADNTGAEDADVSDAGVTISWLDPRFTRVMYDAQDERKARYAVTTWTEEHYDWAQIEYRDRILVRRKQRGSPKTAELSTNDVNVLAHERATGILTTGAGWESADYVKTERDAQGVEIESVIPAEQVNPWGEITVKHFRTSMPYGKPEHHAAYGPASAIGKLLITQLATVDTQGWATRYGLIDPAGALDNAGERVDWEDDSDAPTNDQLKVTKRLPRRARPGEMELFDNLKEVGQWQAADPAVFTDPVVLYMKLLSVTTATPFYSFDPGGEHPSGRSREIEDEPLNAKMEDREAMFTDPWVEIARLSLRMVEVTTKECSPKWKPHTLATTVEDWQAVKAQQEAGVPIRDSLVAAGLPPEEIDQWLEDRNKLAPTTAAMELLGALGDALQRLGHTAATPLVSQETLQGMLSTIVGQIVPTEPDPSLVAQQAEADAKAEAIAQQMAAGTHDANGQAIPPQVDKTTGKQLPPAVKPPKPVGQSTIQAAADDGAPKG